MRLPICMQAVLLLALSVRLWGAEASSIPTCSTRAVGEAAAAARTVQSRLLAVKVGGMDPAVTPATQGLIRLLKDALSTLTENYLRCESGVASDPKTVEQALAARVNANQPVKDESKSADIDKMPEVTDQVYGAGIRVAVSRRESQPSLLMIEWSFGISCGHDSMLLVYQQQDGGWRRVIDWRSGDYDTIGGAFGDFFQYAVVPRAKPGEWAVAVAHGHPWCTSRMSGFDIDVVTPQTAIAPQRVLFHENKGYSRRFDVQPVMKPSPDGFDLRLEVNTIDIEVMTRRGIYRYRTTGGRIERIQPIAMNGRDFVDEWLQLDWPDAARWSAAEQLEQLKAAHAQIARSSDAKKQNSLTFTFGPVRGCSDPNHFQVQLDSDPGKATFFQILQGNNSFTMLSATREPDVRCRGGNLMPKR